MTTIVSTGTAGQTGRRYVRTPSPLFFPSEEEVPETAIHLRLRTALFLILERELRGRAFVGSDQFVYWDPTDPKACLAPDVLVRMGGPLELVPSFEVWKHGAPHVAVEVISKADSRDRDWNAKLERYRRTGIGEVVRFDPEDPAEPLRLWDLVDGDLVERDLSDPEAFGCDTLGVYWLVARDELLGPMLRVSRDREGTDRWLTHEEAEQAERAALKTERAALETERTALKTERAALETERTAKEAALARIAELERKLRGDD
jgi:Uma2 family endonuclease